MYPSLGPSAPPFTLPADMRRNAAAKANTATRPSTRRNFLRSVHGSPQTPPPPSPRRLRRRQRERGRRSSGPTSPAPLLPSSSSSCFFSIAAMELRSPSRLPPFILERLSPTREGEDTHHNFFVSDVEDVVEMLERPEIRKDTWNLHVVLSVGLLHRAGLNMPLPGRAEERALSEGRESRQVWLAVAERGGSGRRHANTVWFACYFSVPFWEKLVFVSKSLGLPLDAAAADSAFAQRSSVAFPLRSRTWNNGVSPGASTRASALREFAN